MSPHSGWVAETSGALEELMKSTGTIGWVLVLHDGHILLLLDYSDPGLVDNLLFRLQTPGLSF